VAEYYSEYKQCFEGAGTNPGEKTLEDKFFEYEVWTSNQNYYWNLNYNKAQLVSVRRYEATNCSQERIDF
jgi:hypothetical protein